MVCCRLFFGKVKPFAFCCEYVQKLRLLNSFQITQKFYKPYHIMAVCWSEISEIECFKQITFFQDS